jgi:hypothetical protein
MQFFKQNLKSFSTAELTEGGYYEETYFIDILMFLMYDFRCNGWPVLGRSGCNDPLTPLFHTGWGLTFGYQVFTGDIRLGGQWSYLPSKARVSCDLSGANQ